MDLSSIFGSSTDDSEDSSPGIVQDIQSYLDANPNTGQELVKIGAAALGNQSAAQIAAGIAGQPKPIAAPASSASAAAAAVIASGTGAVAANPKLAIGTPILIALAVGAYFLFFKKGRV